MKFLHLEPRPCFACNTADGRHSTPSTAVCRDIAAVKKGALKENIYFLK
jgi:hypothetical protein